MKYYTNGLELLNEVHVKTRRLNVERLYEVIQKPKPKTNWYEFVREILPVITDGKAYQTYEVVDMSPSNMKKAALSILAEMRYNKETGGVELPDGTKINTDRESQAMISSAYQSLSNGLITSTEWKTASGWVTVTLTELQQIAQLVANHVNKCFSAEKTVSDIINTHNDIKTLDIYSEFNTAYSNIS